MYFSEENSVGGRQKIKSNPRRRDEYARVDPKRDKGRDKKRDFSNRREVKRGSYED
jgi:hypothetical protein